MQQRMMIYAFSIRTHVTSTILGGNTVDCATIRVLNMSAAERARLREVSMYEKNSPNATKQETLTLKPVHLKNVSTHHHIQSSFQIFALFVFSSFLAGPRQRLFSGI